VVHTHTHTRTHTEEGDLMSDPRDVPDEERPSSAAEDSLAADEDAVDDRLDENELRDDGERVEALDDPLWDEEGAS
jgi:hypothetical protein